MEEKVLCYKVQNNGKTRKEQVEDIFKTITAGKADDNLLSFQPRSTVETDLSYIQLNYGVCLVKEVADTYCIFTNKKINKSSEKRLMGRLNGLVSGHCNEEDIQVDDNGNIDYLDTLIANRDREIAEEVVIYDRLTGEPIPYENVAKRLLSFQHILYSEDAEVSKHHACLYDVVIIPELMEVEIKEKDKLEGLFIASNNLVSMPETDGWTKTLISAELL